MTYSLHHGIPLLLRRHGAGGIGPLSMQSPECDDDLQVSRTSDHHDPLHGYLRDHIVPQLGVGPAGVEFRVFQAACSRNVYLYEEKHRNARLVGKFYPSQKTSGRHPKTGEVEFNNLIYLRGLGLDSPPHYVVKPLGFNPAIGNVLVMEFLEGDLLGTVINDAMHLGRANGYTANSRPWLIFWPPCTTAQRAIGGSTSTTAMPTWGGSSVRSSSNGTWERSLRRTLLPARGLAQPEYDVGGPRRAGAWRRHTLEFSFRQGAHRTGHRPGAHAMGRPGVRPGKALRRTGPLLSPGQGRPRRCRTLHRAFPLGILPPFPGPHERLHGHHPAHPLLHGHHPAADRRATPGLTGIIAGGSCRKQKQILRALP